MLDERLRTESNVTHIRRRSREVPRAALRSVRWLFADLNVAPTYTLDTVGDIIASPKVKLHGMLLTLKMMDAGLAEQIPGLIARVKGWGFESVHVRQLAFNRREVCLMAIKGDRRVGE
jgi:hypothetical protein